MPLDTDPNAEATIAAAEQAAESLRDIGHVARTDAMRPSFYAAGEAHNQLSHLADPGTRRES